MIESHADDLYAVLGLAPDALPEQITRAYRARVREHHPDTNEPNERDARERDSGERDSDPPDRLQHVLDAYAVLRDPARREAYDRRRAMAARVAASLATTWAPGTGHARVSPIRAGPVRWRPG